MPILEYRMKLGRRTVNNPAARLPDMERHIKQLLQRSLYEFLVLFFHVKKQEPAAA